MTPTIDPHICNLARECIDSMGDIFWDYNAARDRLGDYTEPYQVAVAAVEQSLKCFAERFDTSPIFPRSLRDEYSAIIGEVADSTDDAAVIGALVASADWTQNGAQAIVRLARQYGTAVLRNAFALADALGIEDGELGL